MYTLQEIIRRSSIHMRFPPPRSRIKLQKCWFGFIILINLHDRRLIPAPIAIIRRAKYRHHILLVTPVVPLHHQLMSPRHQSQPVPMIELFAHVLAEREPGSTGRNAPSRSIVGIAPQQIAHGSLVRYLLDPIQLANVIQSVDARAESAVEAEYLIFDQGREGKVVE